MLFSLILSCTAPTQRESLEVIALLESGQMFEVRFTKGDTGIFKGQGHLRINRWMPNTTTMSYHIDTPPIVTEIDHDRADFFQHRLYKNTDTWQLYIRSEEYNVSAQIKESTFPAQQYSNGNWNIDLLSPHAQLRGWSSAAGRSAMLIGTAAIFHRHGSDLLSSDRHLLLAFDSTNYFGMEHSNLMNQMWGSIDNKSYHNNEIAIQKETSSIVMTANDESIRFVPEKKLGAEDLYDHLSWAERTGGSLMMHMNPRSVFQGYIELDSGRQLPGIYIYQGTDPIHVAPKKQ